MGCKVFANMREIACKATSGKSICAFPDVCFTPPQAPPTPPGVPIPYPNTAQAGDTTKGTKKVKIKNKEVMLKNKSSLKSSVGNEAGNTPKKGLLTSKTKGKAYFTSWSMDVKFEGKNVVRHLDLVTHNHGSVPGNTPPWVYLEGMDMGPPPTDDPCHKETKKAQDSCKESKSVSAGSRNHRQCDKEGKCEEAMACILVPKGKDKELCCKPNNTGHHLIEDHWIRPKGELMSDFAGLAAKNKSGRYEKPGGPYNGAPTMCANRSRYDGKHGIAHGTQGVMEDAFIGKTMTYADGKNIALKSHSQANPKSNCSEGCIESQLDSFYGSDGSKKMNTPTHSQKLKADQRAAAKARIEEQSDM